MYTYFVQKLTQNQSTAGTKGFAVRIIELAPQLSQLPPCSLWDTFPLTLFYVGRQKTWLDSTFGIRYITAAPSPNPMSVKSCVSMIDMEHIHYVFSRNIPSSACCFLSICGARDTFCVSSTSMGVSKGPCPQPQLKGSSWRPWHQCGISH